MTEPVKKDDEVEDKSVSLDKETEIETPEVEEVQLSESETKAVSFGWKSKEDWVKDGNAEEDWVPAKHFLKFGEVKQQLIQREKQLTKQDKIIKMMKNHHVSVRERAYEDALKQLRAEKFVALEANDLVAVERIRDKMEVAKENFDKQKALPPEVEQELQTPVQPENTAPPEFYEFLDKNPWYITDPKKQDEISQEADKIGYAEVQSKRAKGESYNAREIYKVVEQKIKKLYPEKFATPRSPMSDGPGKGKPATQTNTTRLSEEELAVAKSFDLTPEKYAAEQKRYRGR